MSTVIRVLVLVESLVLLGVFTKAMIRNRPSTHSFNILVYAAFLVGILQAFLIPFVRLTGGSSILWYGTPLCLVWESLLLVWVVKRGRTAPSLLAGGKR